MPADTHTPVLCASRFPSDYIGRFAPSPTGPLHLGSLVAALASFLDARAHQGQWLLRMEDIDPPREQAGAAEGILRCLEAHHLHWDGNVLYQSTRHNAYRDALQQLNQQSLTYYCTCSRQALQGEAIYNGHCQSLHHDANTPSAIRLNAGAALKQIQANPELMFEDLIQGPQQQNLLTEVGDFVIHRKEALFAYQLAVVVDDIFQSITHVIRGADLLESTARQRLLFKLLGNTPPTFGHIPLVLNEAGQKLSKQNFAPALNHHSASDNLYRALTLLNQAPPTELQGESPSRILDWAIAHWQLVSLKSLE